MSPLEKTAQEGDEKETELAAHIRQLVAKVYGKEAGDDVYEEGYRRAAEFARALQQKYPDHERRRAWYILVGGTPDTPDIIEEDFPGEDSVVAFLENILEERAKE